MRYGRSDGLLINARKIVFTACRAVFYQKNGENQKTPFSDIMLKGESKSSV